MLPTEAAPAHRVSHRNSISFLCYVHCWCKDPISKLWFLLQTFTFFCGSLVELRAVLDHNIHVLSVDTDIVK